MKYTNSDIYPLTLLYDSACPICKLEMDHLRERNGAGLLAFVDIAVPGFDARPFGATLADMQAVIHAVRPDGRLLRGVQVIRLAYAAVGLGRWTAPLGWAWLQPVAESAYAAFARNRYGVSRLLTPLLLHIAATRAMRRTQACHQRQCELHTGHAAHHKEVSP